MFNVKRIGIIFTILALVGLVGLGTALAAPPPPKVDTTSTILDSPSGQTAAVGTVVTITGHAETGDGDPVTGGKIQIKELMLNGLGVPCDTEDKDPGALSCPCIPQSPNPRIRQANQVSE